MPLLARHIEKNSQLDLTVYRPRPRDEERARLYAMKHGMMERNRKGKTKNDMSGMHV